MRVYKHGQPFSKELTQNIKDEIQRIRNNMASLLIIDGFVGQGKTTLGIHCADLINQEYGIPPVALDNDHDQIGRGGDEFQTKLRICYEKQLPACVYDEAGDFNKRGSLTKFNAMLNRTFETYRAFKVIPILCLPSFDVLDNNLFDKGIPRILINVHDRNQHQGSFRAYSLWRMYYLKKMMQKITVKPQAYTLVEPNFRGHYLDLEPERSAKLHVMGTAAKLEILKRAETQTLGLNSIKDIMATTGRSDNRIRTLIRQLNIQATKTINYRKYYDREAVTRIMERLGHHK